MSIILKDVTTLRLTENTTINLNNSMSASQIQELIDAQPKDLGGYDLTFQFADGTYNLNERLIFYGFYGPGRLQILGNSSDNNRSTTKSVILNVAGVTSSYYPVTISSCTCDVIVLYLKFNNIRDVSGSTGLYVTNGKQTRIYYSCFSGAGKTTNNFGFMSAWTNNIYFYQNMLQNTDIGISARYNSTVTVQSMESAATIPNYAYQAYYGSWLAMHSTTQATGSLAQTNKSSESMITS